MNRYICIHGHFYQPPRENPWLDEVEKQESAHPFHDWNARITAECYAPNTASRIVNEKEKIIDMVNNYAKISFNFGPTLLTWMERNNPEIYSAIIEADILSRTFYSGHGSAIAQTYNHMILPLANTRDKRTQVIWGIRDFEYRFGRKPEGMWLAETAVDLESLDIMAEQGIIFTILSPRQAKQVRRIGDEKWRDVSGGSIDPRMPYVCRLPSGRNMNIFFYSGQIAQEVAFGGLLNNGEGFAKRLCSVFSEHNHTPEMSHVATDGESYGHHHRFGDMALAYCLRYIESHNLAKITVYGEFLEINPPNHEVEIYENSSWSCAHGVERWKSNCGCNTGMHSKWNQAWRAPLRESLDWLRNKIIPVYETGISKYLESASAARDDYIWVILNRSEDNVENFFKRHARKKLKDNEKSIVLKLLEMERHSMLMYTSCGWFFDEVSGIETVQIIQYADRAMQLAESISGASLESLFAKKLSHVPSNIVKYGNAKHVYGNFVKTARVDLLRVAAHYTITSLFEDYPEEAKIYCYNVTSKTNDKLNKGKLKYAAGQALLQCEITWDKSEISFAVVHPGDHNLLCGISTDMTANEYIEICSKVRAAFDSGNIIKVLNLIDSNFGLQTYSLKHLFKDKQQAVLQQIMEDTEEEIDDYYHQIFEYYSPIVHYLRKSRMELPKGIYTAVEHVLNCKLKKVLESKMPDIEDLKNAISEIEQLDLEIEGTTLSFAANMKISELMGKLSKDAENISLMENIEEVIKLLNGLPLILDLWKAQNICFKIWRQKSGEMKNRAEKNDRKATVWITRFKSLGDYLDVNIE
ncbi:MAG: DUF3536 domain-containing protein [Candidatus Schekmanbacteria bacterium]|nr:DUF3536 domain-containing protein [Candidatus Schekmanbacteria bacterium]